LLIGTKDFLIRHEILSQALKSECVEMGNNSPPQILVWLRFFFVVNCIFHFLVSPPTNIGFDEAEKSFGTFRTLRQEREESQKPSEIVEI